MYLVRWLRIQPFWALHLVAIFDPRFVFIKQTFFSHLFILNKLICFYVKCNIVIMMPNDAWQIKCMKCLGRSEQYDRMLDLIVEIAGDINTLEQALAQFTISETLAGHDKYKCNRLVRQSI